jgi:hypothetical protein
VIILMVVAQDHIQVISCVRDVEPLGPTTRVLVQFSL